MPERYCVPLLSGEQHRSATARQCAELLLHLENVMDSAFSAILQRINDNAKKIEKLKERSTIANEKVQILKGRTKATQIFSSARYPGRKVYCPFKHLLEENDIRLNWQMPTTVTYMPIPYVDGALSEKLEFFHVRDSEKWKKSDTTHEGLGRLPAHVNSISSLLLYNTSHNPYKKHKAVDPLRFSSRSEISKSEALGKVDIHEAPVSLLEGDQLVTKDEFHYLPDLSDLPELDLPTELPTLPGIADDLLYNADGGQSIAPSIILPDFLPVLEMSEENESCSTLIPPPTVKQNTVASISQNITTAINNTVETPSSIEKNIPNTVTSNISVSHSDEAGIPPPPPPPPPPLSLPLPPISVPVSVGSVLQEKSHLPLPLKEREDASSDTRSDLMKAIQAAGGAGKAKLRKVNVTDNLTKSESPKIAASSNDLMGDLNAKLLQRRKGISGSAFKENDGMKISGSEHSTMKKMSSIIPPPPVMGDTDSDTRLSEDDWDE